MSNYETYELFRGIRNSISKRSLYEQLAEEAAELAQAALKMIRATEGSDNPTPIGFQEAANNVEEELTDIMLVCDLIGVYKQDDTYLRKLYRWHGRLVEHEKSKE